MEVVLWVLSILALIAVLALGLIWFNAEHPQDDSEVAVICRPGAPRLQPRQRIKIMTYNVQFFAGKNKVFFFDTPDMSGQDAQPALEDVNSTLEGIAKLIEAEAPDIIFFQEIDDGAKRTYYQDQLALILSKLPEVYGCYTSAFYWKLKFAPHPKLMGSMGLKTAIVSKYQISRAVRRNLPMLPVGFVLQQFSGQKLILQAFLPVEGGSQIAVMSTHLDAFTLGSDVMTRQLSELKTQIQALDADKIPWVLGGDFNMLPPGQYQHLIQSHQSYYNPQTELKDFYQEFNVVPALEAVTGADASRWFTFYGNDPLLSAPDRTLDYLVYSDQLKLVKSHVRQENAERLSDHFPVVASFEIA